jgi:hypothetical protein
MKGKGIGRKHVGTSAGLNVERRGTHPLFFVSVAAKELSEAVSLLFATLAGRFVSVAAKGLNAIVGNARWTVGGNGVGASESLKV